MSPTAIQRLRQKLDESTETFGARFMRSGRTIEAWEQGKRQPDALALKMLEQLAKREGQKDMA